MKKILPLLALPFLFAFLLMICVAGGAAGEASGSTQPVMEFADEEQAYAYQYIGAELGVPWEIAMLADGMDAYNQGGMDLSDYNPMQTSLEFCILQEEEFLAVEREIEIETEDGEEKGQTEDEAGESGSASEEGQGQDSQQQNAQGNTGVQPQSVHGNAGGQSAEDKGASNTGGNSAAQDTEKKDGGETGTSGGKKTETIIEWVSNGYRFYTGCDEIVDYLGGNVDELDYTDASGLVAAIQEAAEEKGKENEVRYEVILLCAPDYEEVLTERIGLDWKDAKDAMDIYECNYLAVYYGYETFFPDIQLPELVQGNITRSDLAGVAVSLLGHPYQLGGKSPEEGTPIGPLDCSGYVDWVYVQCFGTTVSGGAIPDGVAVSGTASQFYACEEIKKSELQVGDLGFLRDPAAVKKGESNHVGIYLGQYGGRDYWIHCGGSAYGTDTLPKGRVGISVATGKNSYNPIDGSEFSPAMKGCKFKYYRRPRFEFVEE